PRRDAIARAATGLSDTKSPLLAAARSGAKLAAVSACTRTGAIVRETDMQRLLQWLCGLVSVIALTSSNAAAEQYPSRTVEIVVAYGAGGSTDFVARAVAQKLGERLGQSFVILNRPGASGTIGITSALRAKPDGYTLFVGYTSETVVLPQISKTAAYSVIDDFEPIAVTGLVPVVLMV